MKRNILISTILITFTILFSILLVMLIPEKNTKLEIVNFNNVKLDLGEYKVRTYKEADEGEKDKIILAVDDVNDFYNNVIKKSKYYVEELEFEVKGFYTLGYFSKDNSLFNYRIYDNTVVLEATFGTFALTNPNDLDHPDFYYIHGPFLTGLSPDYSSRISSHVSFDDLFTVISYIDDSLYKFENNEIYFKGIKSDCVTVSDDYVIVMYSSDEGIKMRRYDGYKEKELW